VAELTPVESRAHQNADALVRQLDRLTRLATRLLQLARIESQANVRLEPVNLAMLSRMVVNEFSALAGYDRLRLYINTDRTGVVGDMDAIGIALRNLIDNALKHGANEGNQTWVRVLVEPMFIMVVNDGPGVPPDILPKLVRPFERGITAAEGSGLGLSITSAILAKGGGTLELRSPLIHDSGFAAVLRFD
jgi:two-component system OmpR family sensor kinase